LNSAISDYAGVPSSEKKSSNLLLLMVGMAIIGCCLFLYSRSQVLRIYTISLFLTCRMFPIGFLRNQGTLPKRLHGTCHSLISSFAWRSLIRKIFIPPAKCLVLWNLLHNKLTTDNEFQYRSIKLCSLCSVCTLQLKALNISLMTVTGCQVLGCRKFFQVRSFLISYRYSKFLNDGVCWLKAFILLL